MTNQIYFSSDLHFNHSRDFVYEPRGFSSIEEMNEVIIQNFNKIVTPKDDLYLLGDIMLGGPRGLESGINLFKRLPGKIHLIFGNHDTTRRCNAMMDVDNVIEICGYAAMLKYHKYHFYLSHYPTVTTNFDDDKPLKQKVLSLSGHTHSKEKFNAMTGSYNVAVDAHNCYPVSIEKIIEDFKEKYFFL